MDMEVEENLVYSSEKLEKLGWTCLEACREDPEGQRRVLQSIWHPELSIQLGQAWLLILAKLLVYKFRMVRGSDILSWMGAKLKLLERLNHRNPRNWQLLLPVAFRFQSKFRETSLSIRT